MEQYLRYFRGDVANPDAPIETEALRILYYKAVAVFGRAFSEIALDLAAAGYTAAEVSALQKEFEFHAEIRSALKKHAGEELDIKSYEADTRHFINTHVRADDAVQLGELDAAPLTQLIVE